MKRIATALILVAALLAAVVLSTGASSEDTSSYRVRAIFDNAANAVSGEDVKIAGAKVGSIESLTVTRDNKAAVVLAIDSKSFLPFRKNATCTIRPQGLIGEKFVECEPGKAPSPVLSKTPKGQDGSGQYLLPLERTSAPVDLDLVNDILRLPFRQRLSVVINEFGTGLAGRGADLKEAINRANPALRQTDKVLKILADENQTLADLARDSDTALGPLSRERARVADFIVQANTVGSATAERRTDIARTFQKFPGFLRQLKPTLRELGAFSDEMSPVLADLGDAAPDLNRFIVQLGPFSDSATVSLRSLGNAGDVGGPALENSQPILNDLRTFAADVKGPAANLDALSASIDKTGGVERLMDYLFFQMTAINGFDGIGHYLRAQLIVNTCSTYAVSKTSGCSSNYTATKVQSASASRSSGRLDPQLAKTRRALEKFVPLFQKAAGAGGKPLKNNGLQGKLNGFNDPRIARERKKAIKNVQQNVKRGRTQSLAGGAAGQQAAADYLLGNDR